MKLLSKDLELHRGFNSQNGSPLGSVWVPHTFSHSWECECDSRVTLLARTFPCLCLGCKPKVKVVTQYVVFRMSPSSQPTHLQVPPLDVGSIVINPHMEVIPVHVEKNIMEDVLLDGGSCVNIIIEDLRKKLRLPIPKPTPLYL